VAFLSPAMPQQELRKVHLIFRGSKANSCILKAIVQAVTHYKDPKILASCSENLGEAMVGINCGSMEPKDKMQGRGW
jgi:pyridoxal biosynthesis lyase PdxS